MAHRLGSMQTLPSPMRRFKESETVDYCIVGVGSAGGVLVQRLARAGFRVVALEAGPFWDTEKDWVSDEKGSHELYWNDLRITGGTHPLALGANNSGKGVGGGSVHWAAFAPRFHPSDFRVYSEDGVGADWPISYWDLKPYYELLEREIPVAGPAWFPVGRSARSSLWAASTRRRRRCTGSQAAPTSVSDPLPVDPSRFCLLRMVTDRIASIAGFACKAAKLEPKPAR